MFGTHDQTAHGGTGKVFAEMREAYFYMLIFNNSTKFFTLLIGSIALVLIWVTSVNAQPQLIERSKLAIDGIGPIRVGMTVAEASRSAGIKLITVGNS